MQELQLNAINILSVRYFFIFIQNGIGSEGKVTTNQGLDKKASDLSEAFNRLTTTKDYI